jgi:hypothetical protein
MRQKKQYYSVRATELITMKLMMQEQEVRLDNVCILDSAHIILIYHRSTAIKSHGRKACSCQELFHNDASHGAG